MGQKQCGASSTDRSSKDCGSDRWVPLTTLREKPWAKLAVERKAERRGGRVGMPGAGEENRVGESFLIWELKKSPAAAAMA